MSPAEDKGAADDVTNLNLGDAVDMSIFGQILEMDEPGTRDFSSELITAFLAQVLDSFTSMDKAQKECNEALKKEESSDTISDEKLQIVHGKLKELSELGHYLKGSSATLGLVKIRDGCEKIQRYGKMENLDGSPEPDVDLCAKRIEETIPVVKQDYEEVKTLLRPFCEPDEAGSTAD